MKYIPSYCQGKLHQIHVPLIYTKLLFEALCLPFESSHQQIFKKKFPCQIKELDGFKIIHWCHFYCVAMIRNEGKHHQYTIYISLYIYSM